jgi:hypothetical protein
MTAFYLWFNAVIYVVFALWCAIRLDATSQSLGYVAMSSGGRTEYLTVYGGLQWGLALVFAWFAFKPELHRTGVLVAMALYAPLVLHRTIGLLRFGPVEMLTRVVAGLEVLMLALAVLLWFLVPDRSNG